MSSYIKSSKQKWVRGASSSRGKYCTRNYGKQIKWYQMEKRKPLQKLWGFDNECGCCDRNKPARASTTHASWNDRKKLFFLLHKISQRECSPCTIVFYQQFKKILCKSRLLRSYFIDLICPGWGQRSGLVIQQHKPFNRAFTPLLSCYFGPTYGEKNPGLKDCFHCSLHFLSPLLPRHAVPNTLFTGHIYNLGCSLYSLKFICKRWQQKIDWRDSPET